MDDDGLVPAALVEALIAAVPPRAGGPSCSTPIPNFHNPAGVTASPQRRRRGAARSAATPDCSSSRTTPTGCSGFDGQPPRAIRADDADGATVIYLGSFSKTFAPGLRVGWALAPHAVREKLVLASEATQLCPSSFTQLAVSTYLRDPAVARSR